MIRLLISSIIFSLILSCNELPNEKITNKLEESIKKIETFTDSKKEEKNVLKEKSKDQNNIFYYIGEPYFIEGVKYIPEENYNYSEIGISTFYGKELHNIKTVNNDTNKVTELLGRHKTLPIPSMVKITNLDNGLSVNVKIIDRHNDTLQQLKFLEKQLSFLVF